jgi:uncharacterized protein (TIGR00290 family)
MKAAVVLWTGGKDSCLALYRARELGHQILALATFVPKDGKEFSAHPREQMIQQAAQLGLPIHFIAVEEPYRSSYVSGLTWIRNNLGVTAVVTGDIDLVDQLPNWIQECCSSLDLEVVMPLWQEPREALMDELIRREMQVKITWINHPSIPQHWLNKTIDKVFLEEMKAVCKRENLDLCGENGEYHTMVSILTRRSECRQDESPLVKPR